MDEKYETAFQNLKKILTTAPVLRGSDWKFPVQIPTDASNDVIGVVLGQKDGVLKYAIYYVSNNLQHV